MTDDTFPVTYCNRHGGIAYSSEFLEMYRVRMEQIAPRLRPHPIPRWNGGPQTPLVTTIIAELGSRALVGVSVAHVPVIFRNYYEIREYDDGLETVHVDIQGAKGALLDRFIASASASASASANFKTLEDEYTAIVKGAQQWELALQNA